MRSKVFWIACGLFAKAAVFSTTFCVVRHGQTDWNVQGMLQGHTDIPLNEAGRAQAEQLRARLEGIPFEACYSSDLLRAFETAQIISQGHGLVVATETRLRERHFGSWEGRLVAELKAATEPPACIETYASVQDRVLPFFKEVAVMYPNSTVLVVAHGGVMRALLGKLLATRCKSLLDIQIENTAHFHMKAVGEQFEIMDMEGIQIP